MLKVVLPDGSEKSYENRVSPLDVASEIGSGLAKSTVAAVVTIPDNLDENGVPVTKTTSATEPLPESGVVQLRLLTKKDPEALEIMRHSCAHVMARAVMRLSRTSSLRLVRRRRRASIMIFGRKNLSLKKILPKSKPKWRRLSRKTSRSSASK